MPKKNVVILGGHLARDVEVRYGQKSNKPWCKFTIGVNDDSEEKGAAAFVSCVAFGGLADKLKVAKKGDGIFVIGKLKTGSYEKDGVKHYTTDVMVEMLQLQNKDQVTEALNGPRTTGAKPAPSGDSGTDYGNIPF